MGRCLAMYDLSGIQSFIFRTNRLKEIVGASYLVSLALFGNVPKLLDEGPDDWKSRTEDDFASVPEDAGRTVYIGGGNAMVLFGSEDCATSFTGQLKRRVFEQTGGALRICSALCAVDGDTRLADCLDPTVAGNLRDRLERSKAKSPHALTARGFSIDALDNETGEPVLYFEKPLMDRGEWKRFMGRSQYLKLKAYKDQGDAKKGDIARSPLLELMGDREYRVEFEDFFKDEADRKGEGDDEKGEDDNKGKRYLAVVHIDGNTMGQRITKYLAATRDRCTSLEEDLVAMRRLSAYIGDLYRNALSQTIDELYAGVEGELPFRPVVADGDDITYICRSEKAFASVRTFVDALHNPRGNDEARDELLPEAQDLSVGVGVAFVNNNYPFSSAYAMAEELCKNAKKAARERFGERPTSPVSSVDFHVCSGEVVTNIADFRSRYLVQRVPGKEGRVELCLRPYHMGDAQTVAPPELQFDSLLRQIEVLRAHSTDDPADGGNEAWIARSKLKGLREKYGEGKEQAVRYGELMVERNKAMHPEDAEETSDRGAFVRRFAEPYVQNTAAGQSDPHTYAAYFDALDVLDLCDGMGDAK